MGLGHKLAIVFFAFVAILAVVVFVAFRERTRGRTLADDDIAGQQAQDARVMAVIFGAIFGGIAPTLLASRHTFF